MDDQNVIDRINSLSNEEERLYERASHQAGGLTAEDQERLRQIEVELDQAEDLLHQRTARRAAGRDPDQARVRPPDVVESYEQ